MTNREYLSVLLTDKTPELQIVNAHILRELLGCRQIPGEECIKHWDCDECWKAWLESEATTSAK